MSSNLKKEYCTAGWMSNEHGVWYFLKDIFLTATSKGTISQAMLDRLVKLLLGKVFNLISIPLDSIHQYSGPAINQKVLL